jgi:hypothetical protein
MELTKHKRNGVYEMINQYHLPKNSNESINNWKLCESNKFIPNESQQFLMDIVSEALTTGLFYTDDIYKYVVEKIHNILPIDYKTRESDEVKNGVMGMEVYLARQALANITAWQEEQESMKRLEIKPGKQIGSIRFYAMNFMTIHRVKVESISDGYSIKFPWHINCSGIRGGKQVTFETSAVGLEGGIESWKKKRAKYN